MSIDTEETGRTTVRVTRSRDADFVALSRRPDPTSTAPLPPGRRQPPRGRPGADRVRAHLPRLGPGARQRTACLRPAHPGEPAHRHVAAHPARDDTGRRPHPRAGRPGRVRRGGAAGRARAGPRPARTTAAARRRAPAPLDLSEADVAAEWPERRHGQGDQCPRARTTARPRRGRRSGGRRRAGRGRRRCAARQQGGAAPSSGDTGRDVGRRRPAAGVVPAGAGAGARPGRRRPAGQRVVPGGHGHRAAARTALAACAGADRNGRSRR